MAITLKVFSGGHQIINALASEFITDGSELSVTLIDRPTRTALKASVEVARTRSGRKFPGKLTVKDRADIRRQMKEIRIKPRGQRKELVEALSEKYDIHYTTAYAYGR